MDQDGVWIEQNKILQAGNYSVRKGRCLKNKILLVIKVVPILMLNKFCTLIINENRVKIGVSIINIFLHQMWVYFVLEKNGFNWIMIDDNRSNVYLQSNDSYYYEKFDEGMHSFKNL